LAISSIRFTAEPEETPGAAAPKTSAIGRGLILEVSDCANRYHLATGIADLKPSNIFLIPAKLLVGLNHHLVGAIQVVEVVYIGRTQVDLQRGEHVGRCQPDLLGFLTVDVHIQGRRAGVIEGKHTSERRILVGRRDKRIGRSGEFLRCVVSMILDHELESTGGAQPLHWRRIDHDDTSFLDAR
jgi:hypothetical protein